jgi:hypothetical protein
MYGAIWWKVQSLATVEQDDHVGFRRGTSPEEGGALDKVPAVLMSKPMRKPFTGNRQRRTGQFPEPSVKHLIMPLISRSVLMKITAEVMWPRS